MLKINSFQTSRRPVILGYLVAIASVVAAMIGLWLMEKEWHAPAHLALFLGAVIISAWFGGTKPTLFAIALSVVAFDYFFSAFGGFAGRRVHPGSAPVVVRSRGRLRRVGDDHGKERGRIAPARAR